MSLVRFITVGVVLLAPQLASGQAWLPGTAVALVQRAAAHRSLRDRDSSLASWHARAHGIVRFTALTGEAPNQVERVLRADELRVEVDGAWPARSKQVIVAWRDTSFLPNTLRYHRDHLGIVANDFGGTIRIGDGDEVRDLIHPLSGLGLVHYQFAMGDTTTVVSARATVRAVAVQVRPVDPHSAGVIGTLYLDLDRAALVRFTFTFTPASYRDASVENITVTLENSLQQGDRWLPWRQSIAIQRGNPLLDLPWHTVIRGDWTIDDLELDASQPVGRFSGPAIDGMRRPAVGGDWDGALVRQLATLPASDADIAQAQQEASRALGGRSLDGLPGLRLFGRGVSDFLHVNRVQGITPALGARLALGSGTILRSRVGVGLSDHRITAALGLDLPVRDARLSLGASRQLQDVGDVPVTSPMNNSLRTLVSGGDRGDYTLIERVGLTFAAKSGSTNLSVAAGREWSTSVESAFTALDGTIHPNPSLGAAAATVARLVLWRERPAGDGWSLHAEGAAGDSSWGRLAATGQTTLSVGRNSLTMRAELGAGTRSLPGYRAFVLGGPGSLLGVPDRALGGRRTARVEVAWGIPVSIGIPRVAGHYAMRPPSTLSLVVAAGVAGGAMLGLPWAASGRVEPVAGLRLDLWGPLLRLESGIALRTGHLGVAFDLHPAWWSFF